MTLNVSKIISYLFSVLLISLGIIFIFVLKSQFLMFGLLLLATGFQSILLERYIPKDTMKDERHKFIIYKSSTFAYVIETLIIFTLAILYSLNKISDIKTMLIVLIIFNTLPFIISTIYNAKKH
ncbi:hypothetical protein ACFWM3_17965 [Gottfriedia sp. NPDC058432]|uniref:hypothetical protein n=1 Tax=Gottfriedia sp. NPDC058432 TaxID=3346497 RepID=UPI00364E6E6C